MRLRLWGTGLAVLTSVAVGAPAAHAAPPPSNDHQAGATSITALPFNDTVDTSRATTDADDDALNAQCGAPVTNGSVWYSFTAPAGVDGIVVDVSQSSFSAGAIIAESDGSGGWIVVGCGPGTTGAAVFEDGDYAILAFSDTPGVTGGTLRISVDTATIPTLDLTVNPRGKVDKYGNALVSGTVTCSGGDFTDIYVSVQQAVGRFTVSGDGFAGTGCDGTTQPWTAVVTPYNGKFAGGKAASFTSAFSCGAFFCADGYVEAPIRLSK
jgi:hypothetical protein